MRTREKLDSAQRAFYYQYMGLEGCLTDKVVRWQGHQGGERWLRGKGWVQDFPKSVIFGWFFPPF
jgi:hypothetical protein